MACLAAAAHGAEWSIAPSVELTGIYDDNVRLAEDPDESHYGAVLRPQVTMSRRTESLLLGIAADVRYTRYSSDDDLNRTDGLFRINTRSRGERGQWGLRLDYREDSTLRTALDTTPDTEFDPDLDDIDIGQVEVRVRRNDLRFAPQVSYNLHPRTAVNLGYSLRDVSYDEGERVGLFDFSRHQLRAGLAHNVTERTALTVTITGARHSISGRDSDTDNYELLGGVRYRMAETLTGNFAMGVRRTEYERDGESDTSEGFVLDGALHQESELTWIRAGVRRTVQPSGIGRSQLSDVADLRMGRSIAPRVEFLFGLHGYRTRPLEGENQDGRRYYEAEPQLRWELSEWWSAHASVRYRRHKFDESSVAATSRAVYLGLSYNWRPLTVSR